MGDALFTLWVFLVAPVVLLGAGAAFATYYLQRANRVGPSRVGPVPLAWLWSPSPAAMLHRRLRSACQVASSVVGSLATPRRRRRGRTLADSIAELAKEVIAEAVRLDQQLVPTSRLARGAPRARALAALDQQVALVEDAAARVSHLAARRAQLSGPAGPAALSLSERIAAMEAALGELSSN
ncbi:MAG: hypothetical protein ACP5VR_02790 [Acidimicrobiales bacterium]